MLVAEVTFYKWPKSFLEVVDAAILRSIYSLQLAIKYGAWSARWGNRTSHKIVRVVKMAWDLRVSAEGWKRQSPIVVAALRSFTLPLIGVTEAWPYITDTFLHTWQYFEHLDARHSIRFILLTSHSLNLLHKCCWIDDWPQLHFCEYIHKRDINLIIFNEQWNCSQLRVELVNLRCKVHPRRRQVKLHTFKGI